MLSYQTPFGRLDFQPFAKLSEWNPVPGLYLFVDAFGAVLYVGQCNSFKERMCGHDRWDEAVRAGATTVYATVINPGPVRDSTERYLIEQLAPKLNTQHLPPIVRPAGLLGSGR